MRVRKLDYIVSFGILFLLFFVNLLPPASLGSIFACLLSALFLALIIGTLTNLIWLLFKKLS